MTDVVIVENVSSIEGSIEALAVIAQVWGPEGARDTDLYFVVAEHGGYLSIARRQGIAVGASFGFLSDGGKGLHSHMTGVVPGQLGRGVGWAMKQHQRSWCAERGIDNITWTFDPLVRRNAWFNLVRLGATISGYRINYYGALTDDLNAGDETDRMVTTWSVAASSPCTPLVATARDLVVPTPDDIEVLRRIDPAASLEWRHRVRGALVPALARGARILGLTAEGSYVLCDSDSEGPL